jgi:ankyrin repeat protein
VGCTPLVTFYGTLKVDLDGASEWGASALDVAVDHGFPLVVEGLLQIGAKPRLAPSVERPLHRAARLDDVASAQLLLAFGADASLVEDGKTAADVAQAYGSHGVQALLAEHRARK